jgi:outer membrane protein W
MRIRIPLSLAVLLFAFSLSAQSNEIGVFFNAPSFSSTSTTDPDIGRVKLLFDGKTGYGISLDHFASPDTAIHISAQKLRAGSRIEFPDQVGASIDAGTMELTEFTAALHWYFLSQRNMVRPYAGAGVARIQSAKLHIPAELTDSGTAGETVSLDSKTTWTADAGIDIHIGAKGAITLSAQYTPYKTHFGAAPDDPVQYMKLNPVTFAGGLRWRF